MDGLQRLVYRSNLLGAHWRITNTGGGNTSSKLTETDPVTGEEVEVLWVKGSGGDLRTATTDNFASLYQKQLLNLQEVYASFDERGPKTLAEDKMPDMFEHCTFNLNPRAPSIDTPLHSFIPYNHVDHTHPVAVIALATAEHGEEITQEIYGDEVVWLDWMRPGFELGLALERLCEEHPQARGAILGKHGLINWADDDRVCYRLSLELIDQAAEYLDQQGRDTYTFGGAKYAALPATERREVLTKILPFIRGRLSTDKRVIATVESRPETLAFINSADAERLAALGTSCPDHFIRTRIKPMYVDWNPSTGDLDALRDQLDSALERYRMDYASYYEEHKRPGSPDMRGSNPTVVLIPGVGMIAFGKSKSESRVTAEFYNAAVEVMRGAEAADTYTALPRQEAFDIEYWRLEQAKIERRPPEEELAREVVVVIGAGSGIGRVSVDRLLKEDATIAALDLNAEAAQDVEQAIEAHHGKGIGVAGSGISDCGDVVAIACDLRNPDSVRTALDDVVLAYGGADHLVITAGYYPTPENGRVTDEDWQRAFDVNVTGVRRASKVMEKIWEAQDLAGCAMAVATSVNGVVPKAGSFAYDASKAAVNHLVRELAVAYAPRVRVNGLAPAAMVEGSAMFPRDRVVESLRKYDVEFDADDDEQALRARLASFYARRTLTEKPVLPSDQAEAVYLLVGNRLEKTTGQILTVDGGLSDAFLR
jgi:rhamnulose-1-phosphate aldolase/alcohol dehydrogenase